ncbi:MAG: hypothetical protein ABI846_05845 [Rudaea sp.]
MTKASGDKQATAGSIGLLWWLAGAAVLFATCIAIRYSGQALLEAYAFRQTQTALTSYWMQKEGWHFAYWTPVAGFPWSVPFEFPIYQYCVALIGELGGWNLDRVGRLVSFAWLVACLWPAFSIARRLKLPRDVALVFCALLFTSPIYVFWGRSFMMETAAVFFSLAAISFALDFIDSGERYGSVLLFSLCASLGCLQKITTTGPVVLVLGCLWSLSVLRRGEWRWREIAVAACGFAVPLLMTVIWTKYSDSVKLANPLGRQLTSGTLIAWNFGTLAQRLDPGTYAGVVWRRVMVPNAAGIVGLFLVAGALTMRRSRAIVLWALLLFAAPILIFTNLHVIHEYYQTANVIFLIAALAIAVGCWLPSIAPRALVPAVTFVLMAFNLHAYYKVKTDAGLSYAALAKRPYDTTNQPSLALAAVVRGLVPADSGLVIFGQDWASILPYYAQRKSFAVPTFFAQYETAWQEPQKFLGDTPLGAVVICQSDGKEPGAEAIRQALLLHPHWHLTDAVGCSVITTGT